MFHLSLKSAVCWCVFPPLKQLLAHKDKCYIYFKKKVWLHEVSIEASSVTSQQEGVRLIFSMVVSIYVICYMLTCKLCIPPGPLVFPKSLKKKTNNKKKTTTCLIYLTGLGLDLIVYQWAWTPALEKLWIWTVSSSSMMWSCYVLSGKCFNEWNNSPRLIPHQSCDSFCAWFISPPG